jgi:hypothetical protein
MEFCARWQQQRLKHGASPSSVTLPPFNFSATAIMCRQDFLTRRDNQQPDIGLSVYFNVKYIMSEIKCSFGTYAKLKGFINYIARPSRV